ncbi:hypothetical protein [Hymenobacter norwichensis]|uniref:hypothetical protein n=1 Tax=Hymenobacter norwichensis TaxID=223903 RepID=UPI0003B4D683|nr:hypothetical protein [Hymenobacter norwichensis]
MAASSETTRRWVATLIVLLLLGQASSWLWRKYRRVQDAPQQQAEVAVQRKIAASRAYDDALLRANHLLDRHETTAAQSLLDSLRQVPTDSLFQIERQKLRSTLRRLDSVQTITVVP